MASLNFYTNVIHCCLKYSLPVMITTTREKKNKYFVSKFGAF
ncbi:hypothetical protein TcasGA2_TC032467 [Tribolium castaneum]|uniref:Uncharacterized protein n=1 Tax=Tribolium castaneum TaxID=7070 RepID=A0A139WLT6_TRICA|nr:hypothetical protein TcasGA2_TC032467 [Tribolium castaneum]